MVKMIGRVSVCSLVAYWAKGRVGGGLGVRYGPVRYDRNPPPPKKKLVLIDSQRASLEHHTYNAQPSPSKLTILHHIVRTYLLAAPLKTLRALSY